MITRPTDARSELQRLWGEKYVVQITPEQVGFEVRNQSKMCLIVKTRDDGTLKLRLIVDLKRSGANRDAVIPQRVVLPRIRDATAMMTLMTEEAQPQDGEVKLLVADVKDAC